MALARLTKQCRECPFVETCEHKEMEALGYLPEPRQYWVLINDEPKEGTILIEMPYPYIIEMICDWWAFSWIKGDLSEMFAWYKDHADYIKMHNNTRSIVEEILEMIRMKLAEVENAEN